MTAAGLAAGLTLGPRAAERPRDAGWAATGTLMGQARARVDQAGLVSPDGAGWSLDWWVGADDRWYLPAREATVRQQRLGAGPVIETAVRIPGGDARHRVYGALAGPVPVTVVEVENDSAVPVALALALRPYGVGAAAHPDAAGGAGAAASPGFAGALSLDGWPAPVGAAHHEAVAVRAGGAVLAVLPRPPAHAGATADRDLLGVVEAGGDLEWVDGVVGPGANAVLLFPLPHRTTLRLLLPAPAASAGAGGELRRGTRRRAAFVDKVRGRGARAPADVALSGPIPDPRSAPGADDVARGWASILAAGARVTVPDSGLGDLADGARGRLLLAAPDLGWRLRSRVAGAGGELAALALTGHHREVSAALAHLVDDLPAGGPRPLPADGAEVLAALGLARSLADGGPGAAPGGPGGDPSAATASGGADAASSLVDLDRLNRLVEWALVVLASVERGGDSRAAGRARAGVALLAAPVDPEGAARLAADALATSAGWADVAATGTGTAGAGTTGALSMGRGDGVRPSAAGGDPLAAAHGVLVGPLVTLDRVNELAAQASPAGVWGGAAGDDAAGAARFVAALRSLLVDDSGPGLDLLPGFPPGWRGGALEVHGLPTRHGPVSFAIRWHGYRPALLWEVTPAGGDAAGPAVVVRAPVLDAGWQTVEPRGEALLTGTGDELPAAPAPGEGFQ